MNSKTYVPSKSETICSEVAAPQHATGSAHDVAAVQDVLVGQLGALEAEAAEIKVEGTPPQEEARSYAKRAHSALLEGRHEEAIADASAAIKLDPDSANAHLVRGIAESFEDSSLDGAVSDLTQALQSGPQPRIASLALVFRGSVHLKQRKLQQAIEDLNAGIDLYPGNALGYSFRAVVHIVRGDTDLAIDDYSRLIELDPDDCQAYMRRGGLHTSKRNYGRAKADFQRVTELCPDSAAAHYELAALASVSGERDAVVAQLTEAIRLAPDTAEFYTTRGKVHLIRGEVDEAVADLTEAIRIAPDAPEAYEVRGTIRNVNGDKTGVVSDLTVALRARPDDVRLHLMRGMACAELGDLVAATEDCERILELEPTSAPGLLLQATIQYTKGDMQGAMRTFDLCVRHHPDDLRPATLRRMLQDEMAGAARSQKTSRRERQRKHRRAS